MLWLARVTSDTSENLLRVAYHFAKLHIPFRVIGGRMMQRAYDLNNPLLAAAETLLGCQEAAREIGIDLSDSLRVSGISPTLLASPKGYLPYHQLSNFLSEVAERCDCPEFGFLVAKHQPPLRFGPAGQLPKLCATINQAIEVSIQYHLMTSEVAIWTLEREGAYATLKRRERVTYDGDSLQLHLLAVTAVFKSLRALGDRDWRTTSISFMHSRPKAGNRMERYFGCPVYYNCAFNGITFPAVGLEIPIASADESLLAVVLNHLDSKKPDYRLDDNLATKTLHHIKQNLGTSQCNLESIAQLLDQKPRTLQRELQKHGVTFKSLLAGVRQDFARHYLRSSDISLVDLAEILGYRNVSAFSRAFKNKSGKSPNHWRLEVLGESDL